MRTSSDLSADTQWGIEAVQLGPDHFRLVFRSDGPFSPLRLHWGDEFIATPRDDGALTLIRVLTPQPYAHYRLLISGGFGRDAPAAMLVHEMGGGWEPVAGGILTFTVPAARSELFAKRMAASGVTPGALTMVD